MTMQGNVEAPAESAIKIIQANRGLFGLIEVTDYNKNLTVRWAHDQFARGILEERLREILKEEALPLSVPNKAPDWLETGDPRYHEAVAEAFSEYPIHGVVLRGEVADGKCSDIEQGLVKGYNSIQ